MISYSQDCPFRGPIWNLKAKWQFLLKKMWTCILRCGMLLGPKFTGTGTTKCTWSNLNIEQAGIGIGFYLKISHFWIENDQNILLKLIFVQNWCIIPRILAFPAKSGFWKSTSWLQISPVHEPLLFHVVFPIPIVKFLSYAHQPKFEKFIFNYRQCLMYTVLLTWSTVPS